MSSEPEFIVAVLGAIIVVITIVVIAFKKIPKRIKTTYYTKKWRDIQKLCSNSSNWPQAVLLADMMLDDVMKKRRINGKTMGERLVEVQNLMSSNESIWTAHKFANHIRKNQNSNIKEVEVMAALVSFRQALRDLGAL